MFIKCFKEHVGLLNIISLTYLSLYLQYAQLAEYTFLKPVEFFIYLKLVLKFELVSK